MLIDSFQIKCNTVDKEWMIVLNFFNRLIILLKQLNN